jgi:hypothetical protein
MLTVVWFDTHVEITVSAPTYNSRKTLRLIRKEDLRYDEFRNLWIVQHPEEYLHVPIIEAAYKSRQQQPLLFPYETTEGSPWIEV